jgi:hypothetical protein
MENRNALFIETELTQASGTAERDAALAMIDRHSPGTKRITLGGDKGFDVTDFGGEQRNSAYRRRCASHQDRKNFGYIKTVTVLRKTRHRGTARVGFVFTLAAAYNLVRIPKLLTATPQ